MAQFSIRIVQQVTEQGSGDFIIEASTAEAAVAVLRGRQQSTDRPERNRGKSPGVVAI